MDNSSSPTCPFCRCEIKGTENVTVEPFHKNGAANDKGEGCESGKEEQ